MLIFGRNFAFGRETIDTYANNRPKSRIGRRNDRYLCYYSAETAQWTEKPPLRTLKSGRNLAFDGNMTNFYANTRPKYRIGRSKKLFLR